MQSVSPVCCHHSGWQQLLSVLGRLWCCSCRSTPVAARTCGLVGLHTAGHSLAAECRSPWASASCGWLLFGGCICATPQGLEVYQCLTASSTLHSRSSQQSQQSASLYQCKVQDCMSIGLLPSTLISLISLIATAMIPSSHPSVAISVLDFAESPVTADHQQQLLTILG